LRFLEGSIGAFDLAIQSRAEQASKAEQSKRAKQSRASEQSRAEQASKAEQASSTPYPLQATLPACYHTPMNPLPHLREALLNILSTKLRSFLAVLGILVGTAAVVALMTSSQLATTHALAQFKRLGTQLLAVSISYRDPATSQLPKRLQVGGLSQIQQLSPSITRVAAYTDLFSSIMYRGMNHEGSVIGASSDFARVAKLQVAQGRFVSELDRSQLFAIIGADLAAKLRRQGLFNPIGQQLLLGNWFFTIIGVLKPWQPNMFVFARVNDGIVVPLAASYLLDSSASINDILIKLTPDSNVVQLQQRVKKKIQQLVPAARINIRSPEQVLKLMGKQRATFTWLLAAIGGISLFVGAIGVMNVMLVSVVERRREIGIRLAIGARQSDILRMFLTEAVMLTFLGGVLGVFFGVIFSYVFSLLSHWNFQLFLTPVLLGFVVAVSVGIFSGFYPALRASRLDPIASMRAE
jgi:putative ABC transport system permease protein